MDAVSIELITSYVVFYTSYVILVLGNIGCICNFITFTTKQLRQSSCGWYFLMSALFDFLCINFGLFTKLETEHYGSTLQDTNRVWCRIRIFFTWVLPCFATGYLVLASIDRCLSTSTNTRLRSFSQIKVAHRMTWVPIILYTLTTSHQFFYYDLRPTCSPLPGTYVYFLSLYSIIWTSLIPQSAMLIFGLITYYNVRKSHKRVVRLLEQQRNRTDSQLITITLVQVLCSSILLNIRTIYFSYIRFSTGITRDNYRYAVETLILQISSLIFYINFSKSFFINTLASKLFRKVFKERLITFYQRITWWKVRVYPTLTTRTDQTELATVTLKENIALPPMS
ncbi:unnamed protein product [Rotaria sp. Silwood1]|nr:unnamed protein product [Rotaria sp. Silwood1]CAF4894192.1 unnamed protein product [Rotaria sp. Silwood1]